MHLALHTGDHRHRLPEITLGVPRCMGQRHEHLLRPPPPLPDVVLDRGVSAGEPMLIPQPFKDPLRRVALLPGDLSVSFQYAVNHPGEGRKLGPSGWVLAPVSWRRRVGQHLAHRVPVQAEHPGGFPNAHPFHHAGPANSRVHFHVVHPSHLPKTDNQPYERQRTVRFSTATMQAVDPPTWSTLPPPFTTGTNPLLAGGYGMDWCKYRESPREKFASLLIQSEFPNKSTGSGKPSGHL